MFVSKLPQLLVVVVTLVWQHSLVSAAFTCSFAGTTLPSAVWQTVAISGTGAYITAGSTNGKLYYSSNFGSSFLESDSPTASWAYTKVSQDGQRQLAASLVDSVVYSSNGGVNWLQSNAPSGRYIMVEADATGQYAILGQDTGGSLYYSDDYGATWTASASAGTGDWSGGAVSYDAAYMYAARDDSNYVYKSVDQGVTWTQLTSAGIGSWKERMRRGNIYMRLLRVDMLRRVMIMVPLSRIIIQIIGLP
mmetsp:Transcript_23586/g.39446  ORF Transcript_23586/g.39446 Transcript_23586/m.39446 type:complete len:249 (+) Transcript_23586:116-862(+)